MNYTFIQSLPFMINKRFGLFFCRENEQILHLDFDFWMSSDFNTLQISSNESGISRPFPEYSRNPQSNTLVRRCTIPHLSETASHRTSQISSEEQKCLSNAWTFQLQAAAWIRGKNMCTNIKISRDQVKNDYY